MKYNKNIMNVFKKNILKVALGVLFIITIVFIGGFSDQVVQSSSVEVGVATLSPLGQNGGYAIPASCPSFAHSVGQCDRPTVSISQNKSTTAQGVTFTVSWSSSRATSCEVQHFLPNGTEEFTLTFNIKSGLFIQSPWATGLSGSKNSSPTQLGTHIYRNTCVNANGSRSTSLSHIVAPPPQCDDGIDNDGDGPPDMLDPSCSGPSDNDETNPPQCSDGIDNDGDGDTDISGGDVSCSGSGDNSELNPTQCNDGVDNDGDGTTDYGPGASNDLGCVSLSDNNEVAPPAELNLEVSDTLVRSGGVTTITWSATEVASCTMTGPNGFNFTTTSGSQPTGAITEQSTYTLTCQADAGEESVSIIVNILPVFEEI